MSTLHIFCSSAAAISIHHLQLYQHHHIPLTIHSPQISRFTASPCHSMRTWPHARLAPSLVGYVGHHLLILLVYCRPTGGRVYAALWRWSADFSHHKTGAARSAGALHRSYLSVGMWRWAWQVRGRCVGEESYFHLMLQVLI